MDTRTCLVCHLPIFGGADPRSKLHTKCRRDREALYNVGRGDRRPATDCVLCGAPLPPPTPGYRGAPRKVHPECKPAWTKLYMAAYHKDAVGERPPVLCPVCGLTVEQVYQSAPTRTAHRECRPELARWQAKARDAARRGTYPYRQELDVVPLDVDPATCPVCPICDKPVMETTSGRRGRPRTIHAACRPAYAKLRDKKRYDAYTDLRLLQGAAWRAGHRAEARAASKAWRDAHPEYQRAEGARRAAIRAGAAAGAERFTRLEIFERDGWKCCHCGKKVNPRHRFPHPQSASLEHLIPVVLGGHHARANVALSHLIENLERGTKATDDQLRLI